MQLVQVNGIDLETRTIPGDAGRPWLVLLHEGLGSVSLWRDFPEKLARRTGGPVLAYSRRGYGQSAALAGPRAPDFMHREALDVLPMLLDAFGIGRALHVGHSDGASIALIHAAAHPERVAGAVLMAPHVMVEDVSVESIRRITEVYRTTDLRQRLGRHHTHVDDAFLGWSDIWLDARFRGWSLEPDCRRLAVPTLVIQGLDDEYGTLEQVDAIERWAPGPVARLVLDGCGHAPHRDREADVIEAIAAFAAGLAPDG
jgi:pimeloyl-ACP methyl ester carboxylesterase